MQSMINNYINGNLTDARKQARRFSFEAIMRHLLSCGYSENRAAAVAGYLKGLVPFQTVCDAE